MNANDEWGLAGKVAIVTGGGSIGDGIGNGRATAILLARSGAKVLVVDQMLDRAENTVAMITKEGGTAVAASYDVTDEAQCSAMIDDAVSRWGRLDCLDNNVGMGSSGSKGTVLTETADNWERMMRLNLESMFFTSKYAVAAMIRTAGGGSIVNISSIAALRPRGFTVYSVSKGAIITLSQALAADHGADGIRANCIVPGPMYTPLVYARNKGMTEDARERRKNASLLKREGTGWDIGYAARFLLSEQAHYITGHTLVVDGGCSLVGPSRAAGTER